eukprot:TRINITY_DN2508_c0_g1_i8.p1 TRINITY_DN2508_c0_g1~~TRINITY_DN2508_c0_g1_i8.p1  ORF type:complete len:333 (+),score=71.57 TRINITY_DN2508_c0_g1_i8:66-1064(+)
MCIRDRYQRRVHGKIGGCKPPKEEKEPTKSATKSHSMTDLMSFVTQVTPKTDSGVINSTRALDVVEKMASFYHMMFFPNEFLTRANPWDVFPKFREMIFLMRDAIDFATVLRRRGENNLYLKQKVSLIRRKEHIGRKTLLLDLDETLIHCNHHVNPPYDTIIKITLPSGEQVESGIFIRPYAIEALRELSKYYEVVCFTASHDCYANAIINYLDPRQEFIHHRLFRDQCIHTSEGIYLKDLRILNNRRPEDLIIVDNSPYAFAMQIDNGVPILPFYDNKSDEELRYVTSFLRQIYNHPDVREPIRQTFRLQTFENPALTTPEAIFEDLLKRQ